MKAMRSVRWRRRQVLQDEGNAEKDKYRNKTQNETNWPVHRPVAAVFSNRDYRILRTNYGRGVAPDLECVDFLFRTNWPVRSPVEAVLLHIWNLPKEMTRKQSFCSGVAPDLEYSVLLQRCCSRSGISWIFAKILDDFSSLPVRSQAHFREITSKFFF